MHALDPSFLQVLVLALQNELAAARSTIERCNLADNQHFRHLLPRYKPSMQHDLERLVHSGLVPSSNEEGVLGTGMGAGGGASSSSTAGRGETPRDREPGEDGGSNGQEMRRMAQENRLLRQHVDRLERSIRNIAENTDAVPAQQQMQMQTPSRPGSTAQHGMPGVAMASPGPRRKKHLSEREKLLQQQVRALSAQLLSATESLRRTESTILSQSEIERKLIDSKRKTDRTSIQMSALVLRILTSLNPDLEGRVGKIPISVEDELDAVARTLEEAERTLAAPGARNGAGATAAAQFSDFGGEGGAAAADTTLELGETKRQHDMRNNNHNHHDDGRSSAFSASMPAASSGSGAGGGAAGGGVGMSGQPMLSSSALRVDTRESGGAGARGGGTGGSGISGGELVYEDDGATGTGGEGGAGIGASFGGVGDGGEGDAVEFGEETMAVALGDPEVEYVLQSHLHALRDLYGAYAEDAGAGLGDEEGRYQEQGNDNNDDDVGGRGVAPPAAGMTIEGAVRFCCDTDIVPGLTSMERARGAFLGAALAEEGKAREEDRGGVGSGGDGDGDGDGEGFADSGIAAHLLRLSFPAFLSGLLRCALVVFSNFPYGNRGLNRSPASMLRGLLRHIDVAPRGNRTPHGDRRRRSPRGAGGGSPSTGTGTMDGGRDGGRDGDGGMHLDLDVLGDTGASQLADRILVDGRHSRRSYGEIDENGVLVMDGIEAHTGRSSADSAARRRRRTSGPGGEGSAGMPDHVVGAVMAHSREEVGVSDLVARRLNSMLREVGGHVAKALGKIFTFYAKSQTLNLGGQGLSKHTFQDIARAQLTMSHAALIKLAKDLAIVPDLMQKKVRGMAAGW